MIRYNANDPAIYGKKHFDILFNFGIFCLVYGACLTTKAVWLFTSTIRTYTKISFSSFYAIILLSDVKQLIYILFWLIIGIGIIFPRLLSKRTLAKVCTGFFILYGLCYLARLSLSSPFWAPPLNFGNVYGFIYNSTECIVIVFLGLSLRRLFKSSLLNRSDDDVDSSAKVDTVAPEPRWVILFERWNPLNCYGQLMVCYGVLNLLMGIDYLVAYWLSRANIQPLLDFIQLLVQNFLLLYFGSFFWFTIAGYGLMRYKEWGRMLAVLAHILFPVTLVLFGISLYQLSPPPQGYATVIRIGNDLINYIPLLVFGYIGSRALSHPVVKHICLRSGHQIE